MNGVPAERCLDSPWAPWLFCYRYDILTATACGFQYSYFYQKIILSPIEKLSLVRFEIIKKSSPRSAKIIIFYL